MGYNGRPETFGLVVFVHSDAWDGRDDEENGRCRSGCCACYNPVVLQERHEQPSAL